MISLLLALLVFVLVLYIAFWLIGMLGLPVVAQRIAVAIVALIGLILLFQRFGGAVRL